MPPAQICKSAPADLKNIETAFGETWGPDEEYTAVVAPGGKIVYAHKGPVNILDMRHAALSHFTYNLICGQQNTGRGPLIGAATGQRPNGLVDDAQQVQNKMREA
jgi:hypothetical protein